MPDFSIEELLAGLPEEQRVKGMEFLRNDPRSCMLCGNSLAHQLRVNGLPSQLCDACIQTESTMGSFPEELDE